MRLKPNPQCDDTYCQKQQRLFQVRCLGGVQWTLVIHKTRDLFVCVLTVPYLQLSIYVGLAFLYSFLFNVFPLVFSIWCTLPCWLIISMISNFLPNTRCQYPNIWVNWADEVGFWPTPFILFPREITLWLLYVFVSDFVSCSSSLYDYYPANYNTLMMLFYLSFLSPSFFFLSCSLYTLRGGEVPPCSWDWSVL